MKNHVNMTMAAIVAMVLGQPALADDTKPLKIGILSDLSSAYSDVGGKGIVEAVNMAVSDFGGSVLGKPIEVVVADALNKPDVSSAIARRWWDAENVDTIVDLPTTSIALALMELSAERKKVLLATSPGSSAITGASCSPYTVHWTYDSYAMAHTLGTATVKQGGDSWFFIAADYAHGEALVKDTSKVVTDAGGKILGVSKAPLNNSEFSSQLLEARSSGAKIIGLANGGLDLVNTIKQASDFGLTQRGQKLAALVLMETDAKSIGLETAQGTLLTTAFYWDLDDEKRAFSKRFQEKIGRVPTMLQAGAYSQISHYLKAVKAAGTKEAGPVIEKMRELPVSDFFAENGTVRKDGRMVHEMYLMEVKKPSESKGDWDLFKLVAKVPGEEAFRPLSEGGCPLVN